MSKFHRAPIQTTPFFHRSNKMPSPRRIKVFSVLIFVSIICFFFYRSSVNQQSSNIESSSDFYSKTVNALDKNNPNAKSSFSHGEDAKSQAKLGLEDEDDEEVARAMAQRLKDAAQEAKDKANLKAPKPDPPSAVVGKGSAADGAERGAGRRKFGDVSGEGSQEVVKEDPVETEEDKAVNDELNLILKKSPIIIFSKSYCPHSRRAKGILLEKYVIDPKPYVVELDKHEIGLALQARLADLTGRRTVPNVLINGISIGGGDDVAELDVKRKLIDKINELGGKKMLVVKERPVDTPGPAAEDGGHGLR